MTGKHWEQRGSGTGKGPRDGNRTRVAVSTVALYADALTVISRLDYCNTLLAVLPSCTIKPL